MKSFEYLHKLFVHKNNQCYQTCWLCNDFRIARGNRWSHPILRLWTRWSPLESRISQWPVCELWEVWEQTLNTRARQLFRRSVAGGRGQVVSQCCEQRAGSWAGTGPAGSEVRLHSAVQSSVRGPLVLISTEIDNTSNERRATSYWRLRRKGGRLGHREVSHKSQNVIWLNKLISFTHLGSFKECPDDILGQIKSYDSRDDQQLFLDSSLTADQWKAQFSLVFSGVSSGLQTDGHLWWWVAHAHWSLGPDREILSQDCARAEPGPPVPCGRGQSDRARPCVEPGAVTLHEAATLVVCGRSVSRPAQSEPRALSGKIAARQKKVFLSRDSREKKCRGNIANIPFIWSETRSKVKLNISTRSCLVPERLFLLRVTSDFLVHA